jgi:hypothetical protein
MQYCQVTNNTPGPPGNLPQNWQNVSNFNLLPVSELAKYGFYPFNPATPPAYTEATQKLVETLQFTGSAVNQTWQVVALTQQEQIAFATARLQAIGQAISPFLDASVGRKQYDSIISATSWNLSNITIYKQESEEATAYRDQVWLDFGNLVSGVQAGNTPLPTVQGWLASLPPLWANNGTGG